MNRRPFLMGLVGVSTAAAATAELAQAASLPEADDIIPNSSALSETDAEYSILMRAMVRRGIVPRARPQMAPQAAHRPAPQSTLSGLPRSTR